MNSFIPRSQVRDIVPKKKGEPLQKMRNINERILGT